VNESYFSMNSKVERECLTATKLKGFLPERAECIPADGHVVEFTFRIVGTCRQEPLFAEQVMQFDGELVKLNRFSLYGYLLIFS